MTIGSLGKRFQVPAETERKRWQPTSPTPPSKAKCSRPTKPVLVDFWAEWCGPCHAVAPVLERIADERDLKLVKVNIDENQDLAMRYGIQSIPNMMLFEGGAPKASAVGAMPKGMLEQQLGFES